MRLTMAERLIRLVLATGLALARPTARGAAGRRDRRRQHPASGHDPGDGRDEPVPGHARRELRGVRADARISSSASARDLQPIPAFATSWERAADGKSWTFKFRPDLKWSDGQPATSADACFSWQLNLDAIKDGTGVGYDYLTRGSRTPGSRRSSAPTPRR